MFTCRLYSSKSNVPVWPFLVLSFFGGAYALLPYFAFWKPPPPPVDENQLKTWPLNFLESKVTAGVSPHLNFIMPNKFSDMANEINFNLIKGAAENLLKHKSPM